MIIINIFRFLRGYHLKWYGFRYTRTHYYLLVLVLLEPYIAWFLFFPSLSFVVKFVAFGIFGIILESFFNYYWEHNFGNKLWIYHKDVIFDRNSSWLNFIPWCIGGCFYTSLTSRVFYQPTTEDLLILWTAFLIIFFTVIGIRALYYHLQKIKLPAGKSLTLSNSGCLTNLKTTCNKKRNLNMLAL